MQVLVGSMNEDKVEAVILALFKLGVIFDEEKDVIPYCAPSGQNEQPVGFDEIIGGALHRAEYCIKQNNKALAIGIENGVIYTDTHQKVIDIAAIVVLVHKNEPILATSMGIEFPLKDFRSAQKAGLETCTVAGEMRRRLKKKGGDPHLIASGGKISRKAILIDPLLFALSRVSKKILPR